MNDKPPKDKLLPWFYVVVGIWFVLAAVFGFVW